MRATKRYRLVHFYSGLRASTVSDWFWFYLWRFHQIDGLGSLFSYLWLFTPIETFSFSSSKFCVERPASTFICHSPLLRPVASFTSIPVPLLLFSYLIPHTVSKKWRKFTHLLPILEIIAWSACDISPQYVYPPWFGNVVESAMPYPIRNLHVPVPSICLCATEPEAVLQLLLQRI